MNHLELTYKNAVETTKAKIFKDLNHYLGSKESIPSFENYLSDRESYIGELWLNVWLNKSTSSISKAVKKQFLQERGFETENVDRKLINQLFRTEMRTYIPFDAIGWLKNKWQHDEINWEEKYREARAEFLQKEEEERLHKELDHFQEDFIQKIDRFIEGNEEEMYLHVRHFISKQLIVDMNKQSKYKKIDTFALEEKLETIGEFTPDSYTILGEFLEELTGDIHKSLHWGRQYFEYETYFDRYIQQTTEYLKEVFSKLELMQSSKDNENLSMVMTQSIAEEIILETCEDLADHFIRIAQEEYLTDLIRLAAVPFEIEKHAEIYKKDIEERKRRIEEEQAELERKKEEEKRILNEIFEQEYQPYINRNIRYKLHIGETNTGKTHHALEKMKSASSGIYLAPLRLLALEVFDKLNEEGTPCSLKTGEEEKITAGARHISCTVEMFHEKEFYKCIVIDEAQMITDKDRGFSWYKAITKANADEVHIIGSHNVKEIILQLLGAEADIEIIEYNRDIPLEVEKREFKFSRVDRGDALICFSRKKVLETASRLENSGQSVSMIYGSMPPETRKKQVQRFNKGETSIIVATDAIGMGLNLPIRRVVFLENEKFDGQKRRQLTSQEVKQIAGRAGRKGIYNIGKVAFISNIKKMWDLLVCEDQPIQTFSVAPTNTVFERFQRYYRDLGTFFELWDKFESPVGTKKASLSEERELYEKIQGTEIEAKLPIMELYGFLHLPFSKKESELIFQWEQTMLAIIAGEDLPEPRIKNRNLEELELTYKAIGLHLLFLYRLDRRTEALYWERVREQISDKVHDRLRTDIKNMSKKCKSCGRKLPWDLRFQICDQCHERKYRRSYSYR
ncbi:DEAD/DEAH box helicase [Bacillus sp. S/N-304-OC-R1]|uniref:DEAD/DEAH box helicase n=1 Tax=Bacillus sp. S/N-304-OC-R1 TaxID=2758034 RepID=UPI001C8E6A2C|nr:DEAD/DEAH box helicase [Bacillus sp. S/N-304-OC-R1]MBY0120422.1 DEAD/DEAH box helicase [Bacillus sp. S/N-304-OC-R1]